MQSLDAAELDKMRDNIAAFIAICERALTVYNQIAKDPLDDRFKTEIEKHFANLRTEIHPYTKKPSKNKEKKKKTGGVKFLEPK
jgi:hypothetical protein